MRPLPIGVDDFRKLREQEMEYVDKTHLTLLRQFFDPEIRIGFDHL
jgi:hypothetical protein